MVAQPAGAAVLVRRRAVPACGIPVCPEAAVAVAEQGPAAEAPGRVVEVELVVGVLPVVVAALVAQVPKGQELAVEVEGLEPVEGLEVRVGKPHHRENG